MLNDLVCSRRLRRIQKSTLPTVSAAVERSAGQVAKGRGESWDRTVSRELVTNRDICLSKLSEIPTVIGKLVHVAVLQRPLGRIHKQVFTEWLSCPLEQQLNDLLSYAYAAAKQGVLPDAWLSPAAYQDLMPCSIGKAERSHYFSNLDIVLSIVREEQETF